MVTALLCGAVLFVAALPRSLAADPLGKVRTVQLRYQANVEMKNCKAALANALADEGIGTTNVSAQADAILMVKLEVVDRAIRSTIHWGAILEDHKGKRLYSAFGEESSWTAEATCVDLAEDLAEDLIDDIRNARVLNF